MSTRIAIAGVSERDIDLLLLEEFQSSPSFQDWFVAEALGPSVRLGRCIAAERSVYHSAGESDLEVTFLDSEDKKTRLMIENKVGAGLQQLQAQRYQDRGQQYIAGGDCVGFYTVIVAPARYFGTSEGAKGFGSRVTYEQVLSWFQNAAELGDRRNYKTKLLQSAIQKGTLGWQPEEDKPNTRFWQGYWRIATERAPELEMWKPAEGKPSRSGFIGFHPRHPPLPNGIKLYHKFNHGHVDLQLAGMGRRVNEVNSILGQYLEPGMTVESAAMSAAIRVLVPKLTSSLPVEEQISNVYVGIEAAKQLYAWFQMHQGAWVLHAAPNQVP